MKGMRDLVGLYLVFFLNPVHFGIVLKLFTHGIFHQHFCKKCDSNMVIIVENNKQLVICFHYYIFVIQIFNFLCSAPIVGQRHYKTCTVLSYRFNDTKAI